MLWARNLLFIGLCTAGLIAGWSALFRIDRTSANAQWKAPAKADVAFRKTVAQVNAEFRAAWKESGIEPVAKADDLTLARRLALSLAGTVPSLAEIRKFEALPRETRLSTWIDALLADRRSADYLAERYARQFVGVEDGPFLLYRRRRFVAWLADELHQNRPLDAICRQLISETGLWTDHPATNFITVTSMQSEDNKPDVNKLAGRVSRSMLGIRLDCAQCHDHPFNDRWKQKDFEQLAAFFGETALWLTGVQDKGEGYYITSPDGNDRRKIEAAVPFDAAHLPEHGSLRHQLAHWITDQQQPYFARAQVNRVWGLMFGRPLVDPVDDLPLEGPFPPALETLTAEFVRSGYNLQRLVRIIASLEVFQLESAAPAEKPDFELTEQHEKRWAVFPLIRLRPEQVVGGLLQAASLETIGYDSHIIVRLARSTGERDFVKQYGDVGENELADTTGTIPQRLVLLNGDLVEDKTRENLVMNAATRIAALAPTNASAVETAYLAVLTRRPTHIEAKHFAQRLDGKKNNARTSAMADLYWVLLNSSEFAWNH